jgi:phage-related minor tail protein
MAGNQKDVKIVVGVKNDTQRGLNDAKSALNAFASAQQRAANRRAEIGAAREATAAYQANAKAVRDLAAQVNATSRPRKALKADFEAAKEAARQSKAEMDRLNGALRGVGGSARGSFAAFEASVRSLNDQSNAAARADGNLENLNAELPRMAAANNQATRAINANAAAMRNQAGAASTADKIVGAYASRQGRGPLGLRPYELTNLGYQVNDLITQIASGTSPMQAFAQQSGQIIQIFPKMISGLLRFFPLIAAAAAAIGTFVAAMTRLGNLKDTQQQFSSQLAATAESAAYSAAELAKTAQELDEYSGSLKEARASIAAFIKESVDPSYITEFGEAARDMAKVFGVEIPDASEKVAEAFTGNYDSIKELDDAFNFLSVAERKHIRELFESGKASEARTEAFEIFARKMDEGAGKMNGPWSQAIDNVGNAWRGFLDWLGNTSFIQGAISLVDGLARKVQWLTSLLPGANGAADAQASLNDVNRQLGNFRSARTGQMRTPGEMSAGELSVYNGLLREKAALTRRIAEAQNAADPRNATDPRAQKEDEDAAIERQKELQTKLNALARQRAQEIARQREAQQDFLTDLQAESDEREFQISLLGQTEREQAVLTALREAEIDGQKVGLTLSEDQLKAIRASVAALYDAEAAHDAALKVDQLRLDLAKERGQIESQDAYVSRRMAELGIEAVTELDEATGDYVIRLSEAGKQASALLIEEYKLMAAAKEREALEKTANDQLKLRESLMESIKFYQEQGDDTRANALKLQLDGMNTSLLAAVGNLIDYFAQFQTPEAQAALDYWTRMRDQIAQVDQKVIVTGKDINEGIANIGVSAFDRLAEAVANGEDAWGAFIDGFRQAASEFLRQIAQMIIQQAILNALGGGPTGGGGAGGGIAGFINGLFRHNGGLVGTGGGFKQVSPAAFAGAYRYHSGGIAGLKPDEVGAVLKKGEEVLTDQDPRHRANGGLSEQKVDIKNINLFDPVEAMRLALADTVGQKVFLNFVRNNQRAFGAAANG